MREFWLDQGFTYNPNLDLCVSKCPQCQGVLFGSEIGYRCETCKATGTFLDWLWKVKRNEPENAERQIKYYKDIGADNPDESINPNKIAGRLALLHNFIYHNSHFYTYTNGVYSLIDDMAIDRIVKKMVHLKFKSHVANEIRNALAVETFVPYKDVNSNKYLLNFKNCLIDLNTLKPQDHSPEIISTIQLNLNYDKDANCPLWLKTLDEIFEGDKEKTLLLQQFLGYCLVPDNKFQISLLNIGEGANGKSLIMKTFQNIMGNKNYSTIQSADFRNKHYIACMADKLVNISIESDNKMSIDDATFKAITSGDEIQVEEKFISPYPVRLFCKLIFTMNELPRVDDRSNAFFRRLKILRYNKEFKHHEQDNELEFKLEKEYAGIMNWLIFGFKNLYKNKGFLSNTLIDSEILEYKKANNNTYEFAEECLAFEENLQCSKKDLYARYCKYCAENNYKPFAIKKMGKELNKIYPKIITFVHPSGIMRMWKNVGILKD